MITYSFLQHYWWFLVSLLGGLLVFLLFVQGANTLIFSAGKTESERELIINSTGRKWELTFTTLVTFGGAFFASFPLFYSVSFSGAYWVWMLVLISFVLQAVAYEYQGKEGNVLGKDTFRWFLVFNGFFGPFLLGAAVSTFFTGSAFEVSRNAITNIGGNAAISGWSNAWHGLDALGNIWNVVFGFAVFFLARTLGSLYMMNNIDDETLVKRLRRQTLVDAIPFVVLFVGYLVHLLLADGFAVGADGTVSMEAYKYFTNFMEMPLVTVPFLLGVVLVLVGIGVAVLSKKCNKGIWWAGLGTVITVTTFLLIAGYNGTSYYPSVTDLQSSLTIANSSSSEFTLEVMAVVSLFIPLVLAYIVYCWYKMDAKSLTKEEMKGNEHTY